MPVILIPVPAFTWIQPVFVMVGFCAVPPIRIPGTGDVIAFTPVFEMVVLPPAVLTLMPAHPTIVAGDGSVLVIVTVPVPPPDTAMPAPATTWTTPVFVMVGAPVLLLTLMPDPAATLVTPLLLMVGLVGEPDMKMPPPD